MGLATICSRAQLGLAAPLVQVEVHLAPGLPCFNLVGLPAPVVRESRERVRAALCNSGCEFPAGRITVNLAPVELAKEGGRYDLPIALGLLLASGQASYRGEHPIECYGELGLSGELKPVGGLLLAALQARAAGHLMLVPPANVAEVRAAGVRLLAAPESLLAARDWLRDPRPLGFVESASPARNDSLVNQRMPFYGVMGHWGIKRALLIGATGGHSILLCGPPGAGKTLLASQLPALLPPLTESEALEVAGIHSLASGLFSTERWGERPWRAPHHTASASAIIGGGPRLLPGEISLAHRGVLFLDELPEFDRRVLESLREPLESGSITLARARGQQHLPADFQLIAAMNPCPCGHLGDTLTACRCAPRAIDRYRARISGPLLDRIDLRLEVPRQEAAELLTTHAASAAAADHSSGTDLRAQVCAARQVQLQRAGCLNARLPAARIENDCRLDAAARALLLRSEQALKLSGRGVHRIQRLARTVADLAGCEQIGIAQLAEAIQLRRSLP